MSTKLNAEELAAKRYKPLCPDDNHADPDHTGLCIKCNGILEPDAEDWELWPERCVGGSGFSATGSDRLDAVTRERDELREATTFSDQYPQQCHFARTVRDKYPKP